MKKSGARVVRHAAQWRWLLPGGLLWLLIGFQGTNTHSWAQSNKKTGLESEKRSERLEEVRSICRANSLGEVDDRRLDKLLDVIHADVGFVEDATLVADILNLLDQLSATPPPTNERLRALVRLADYLVQQRIWLPPEQRSEMDDRLQRVVAVLSDNPTSPAAIVHAVLATRQLYSAMPQLQQQVASQLPELPPPDQVEACGLFVANPNRSTVRQAIPVLAQLSPAMLESSQKLQAAKHISKAIEVVNDDDELLGLLRVLVSLGPEAQPALGIVRRWTEHEVDSTAKLAQQAWTRISRAVGPAASARLARDSANKSALTAEQLDDLVALIHCDDKTLMAGTHIVERLAAERATLRWNNVRRRELNREIDSSRDSLALLIEALGVAGDASAVTSLADVVRDTSLPDKHRHAATLALARCGPAGATALVELLDTPSSLAPLGLARTENTAVELLVKAIDRPPQVSHFNRQFQAIDALDRIGPPASKSYDALLAWASYENSNPKVTRSGGARVDNDPPPLDPVVALKRRAFSTLRSVDPERAVKHYQQILETALDRAPRGSKTSYSIPPLTEKAVYELGKMGDHAAVAIPSLIAAARIRWTVQNDAVLALKNLGPIARSALPELKRLSENENSTLIGNRKRLFADAIAAIDQGTRTWRARGGATTQAEFVHYERGRVTLRRVDGKLVTLAMDQLVEDDQRFVLAQD